MSQRKFIPPVASHAWVRRPRLLSLLDRSARKGMTFVSAPGGSGKTVAMSQWLAGFRNKAAWLTLDRYDNAPQSFYAALLGAMAQAQKANRKLRLLADRAEKATDPLDFFLKAMTRTLDNDKSYCLVVDDFQKLDNPAILETLPLVIGRMPANFALFTLSRMPAPEPFAGLIAKGRVAFVSAVDLRFDTREVRELAALRGNRIGREEAEAIRDHTGGWALGVEARLDMADGGDETFHSREDYFNRYLENYIWANWSPETRDMLLKTSMAPSLDPDFCNHMTGRGDCRKILQTLCAENPFIARLEKDSYRLHDLFRDWLARKWEGEEYDGERRETRLRAARWFHRAARYPLAVELYAATGEYGGIVQARLDMSRYDVDFCVENHLGLLEALETHNLPAAFIDASPELVSLFAWGNWLRGRIDKYRLYAGRLRKKIAALGPGGLQKPATKIFLLSLDNRTNLTDFSRRLLATMPPPPSARAKTSASAQVASIMQNLPLVHRSMRDFSDMVAEGEEGDVALRGVFGAFIGPDYRLLELAYRAGLHYERGETELARAKLAPAVGKETLPEFHTCVQTLHYLLLREAGADQEAASAAAALESYLEDRDASFLWPNALAMFHSFDIARGDTEKAREWLEKHAPPANAANRVYTAPRQFASVRARLAVGECEAALELADTLWRLASAYARPLAGIESGVLRAQALWRLGRSDEAVGALGEAVALARPYGYTRLFGADFPKVAPILRQLLHRKDTRAVDRDFAAWLLETAAAGDADTSSEHPVFSDRQLEILLMLRRDRSSQRIASELAISPNTVKHHLGGIFRLLGVNNREEAVRVAKTLKMPGAE